MIIKKNQDEIEQFLSDASNYRGECEAVYFPETGDDIISILSDANKNGTPVTVAGAGTGLTGAAVPEGGIVVSMAKFNKIIGIDKNSLLVKVQAGVILSELQAQLNSAGLLYPPDPTETDCFVGGTIATNASGAKTFLYGPTRSYVQALSIILPNGEKFSIRRGEYFVKGREGEIKTAAGNTICFTIPNVNMPATKNAAGYYCKPDMDIIDLFIGSEGTLGIITEAELSVVPLPEDLLSAVAFFRNEDDALSFIEEARELTRKRGKNSDGLRARALEYFDEKSLAFLKPDYPQIDQEAKAAVWFEQEVTKETADDFTEEWFELIVKHNGNDESIWAAVDESDRKGIRDFRHAVSAKVNEYIARNNYRKLGTDVAVPDDAFRTLYFNAKSFVESETLDYIAYGHFGNSHLHLNMLPKSESDFRIGKAVYRKICEEAVSLGGTVSAEHGIGKIKRDYLVLQYGRIVIDEFIALKRAFDPEFILGKGTMFTK